MNKLIAAVLLTLWSLAFANDWPDRLPEFTMDTERAWINSTPLRLADLKGQVVLIDFWTFDCWNCYRSFPWLNDLEARYARQGLRVIGIHSPEFEHERDAEAVRQKARRYGLDHPIMLDNDFAYWKKMGNRYWPSFYIADKQGRIRGHFIGEVHAGDRKAKRMAALVASLLNEEAMPRKP